MFECTTTNSMFGLSVSVPKTKFMVEATDEDRIPINVNGNEFEHVSEFPYLGSVTASSGRMDPDVNKRIAQASKAFGALTKQYSWIRI